jgi:hypothetical protein
VTGPSLEISTDIIAPKTPSINVVSFWIYLGVVLFLYLGFWLDHTLYLIFEETVHTLPLLIQSSLLYENQVYFL